MNWQESWQLLIGAVLGAALSAFATWAFSISRLPTSHRVAILGFPRSGKTTLITALFAYLFRRGLRGASVIPRGEETLRRINANMQRLELRQPIAPTTDQDVFAYRAEVSSRSPFFSRRYKLEIGDFPGERTVVFSESDDAWLHDTPYFQWAMAADAFIFVVDVGSVILDPSGIAVARQKAAFRAAWQRLQDHHFEGATDVSGKTLILAFTKADLLLLDQPPQPGTLDAGLPPITEVPLSIVHGEVDRVLRPFADLIDYFERESRQFDISFVSVVLYVEDDPLGIPELARQVMRLSVPRRGTVRRAPVGPAA